jgi:hypothetical protein
VKKAALILILLAGFYGSFAENQPSNLYVKSFPIAVVNVAREGYRIVYMKGDMTYHVFYCPIDWFTQGAAGKGEVLYGSGAAFPYFSVFWEDGQFSHIKLYLHSNRTHISWRDLPPGDYSGSFNVEAPDISF